MPDGGWLIVIIVGVLLLAVFGYMLVKGHLDANRMAKTIGNHAKKLSGYLSKKRKHQEEAEKEKAKNPEPKPYDPNNVVDFLDRTNKKWPPD